jgi:diguanylate cyclase (GGDEF)-like protein
LQLDSSTLIVVNVVTLVAMSLTLPVVMGRGLSPAARHVRTSLLLKALAWVLLALSARWVSTWPFPVLTTLALALMGWGHVLLFRALEHWLGPRPLGRLLVALAVLMPLGFALSFHNYPVRVSWFSLLLAAQLAIVARATLWPAPSSNSRGGWRFLLASCLGVVAMLVATRGLLAVVAPDVEQQLNFHSGSTLMLLTLMATNVTLVLGNVAVMVAWREEAELRLHKMANTDALTGLLNRNGWATQAGAALRLAQRHGCAVSLLMLDVDHFKRINDTHGHEVGDAALQLFGRVLQSSVRGGDLCARLGGEEFCLLLMHADTQAAMAFDQRLRALVTEATANELRFALDFSTGHALYDPEGESLQSLMSRADAAMYRAKHEGRGRLVAADTSRPAGPPGLQPNAA